MRGLSRDRKNEKVYLQGYIKTGWVRGLSLEVHGDKTGEGFISRQGDRGTLT